MLLTYLSQDLNALNGMAGSHQTFRVPKDMEAYNVPLDIAVIPPEVRIWCLIGMFWGNPYSEVFGDVYGTLFSAVLGDGVWVKPFHRPYLLYTAYIHR